MSNKENEKEKFSIKSYYLSVSLFMADVINKNIEKNKGEKIDKSKLILKCSDIINACSFSVLDSSSEGICMRDLKVVEEVLLSNLLDLDYEYYIAEEEDIESLCYMIQGLILYSSIKVNEN